MWPSCRVKHVTLASLSASAPYPTPPRCPAIRRHVGRKLRHARGLATCKAPAATQLGSLLACHAVGFQPPSSPALWPGSGWLAPGTTRPTGPADQAQLLLRLGQER